MKAAMVLAILIAMQCYGVKHLTVFKGKVKRVVIKNNEYEHSELYVFWILLSIEIN